MAFPGSVYAPPGVYTRTLFEDPVQGIASNVRIPLLLGVGSEILRQNSLEVIRGSSSSVDQRVVQEDEAGRAVVSISAAGAVTLGEFDGTRDRLQVRNFPIVTGAGTGTVATNSSSLNVTVNGKPIVVLSVDGAKGILQLSTKPLATDVVRVTYFFNRTDTLITDDLSDQVTADASVLYGAVGQNFEVISGENDSLTILVDDASTVTVTISSSPTAGWTAAQVAAFINAAATGTTLVATSALNNFGQTVLKLSSDRNLKVLAGSANPTLGLTEGSATSRNAEFYTFQRPIVDGTNGGVTTTDPSDVTVKVNGVQVIPTAVDGQTGAVTLPFAPQAGATVTCQYYFNSWQNTFDYLQHRGVTDIFLCGITPDRSDYVEGVDFVLKDDQILWGTASLIESGVHTSGSTYFGSSQVTSTLVDVRQYLAECSSVVDTSVNPPVEGRKQFTLPLQPTTGNGRNTPITGGADTFKAVANGRQDLPTNRPDLVWAYWGYSIADAVDRGRVTVTKVDSDTNTITLASPVPTGAKVWATFYYNTIQDQEYTLAVVSPGVSGLGTYTVQNGDGAFLLTPSWGTKSAGLSTVVVNFPSGSEKAPDARFETPFNATNFVGSVEEDVTVTFASQDATLAKFAVAGASPYYLVRGASDNLALNIDNSGVSTFDLSDPTGNGTGFFASYVGEEVSYNQAISAAGSYEVQAAPAAASTVTVDGTVLTEGVDWNVGLTNAATATSLASAVSSVSGVSAQAIGAVVYITAEQAGTAGNSITLVSGSVNIVASGATLTGGSVFGTGFEITASNNGIDLQVDGVLIQGTLNTGSGKTVQDFADAINRAAFGEFSSATFGTLSTVVFPLSASENAGHYNNWVVKVTSGAASGDKRTISGYVGATRTATVSLNFSGVPALGDTYVVYNPDTLPYIKTKTRFLAPTNLTGGFATLKMFYSGDTTAPTAITASIPAANYTTVSALAAAVQSAIDAAVLVAFGTNDEVEIFVEADSSGRLVFLLAGHPADTQEAVLEFTDTGVSAANNFAILAGLDVDSALGNQAKIYNKSVASVFTFSGTTTGIHEYDRLLLNNRLLPGQLGSIDGQSTLDQCQLKILGGTGATLAGLTPNAQGLAGIRATMMEPTLFGEVGLSGGQSGAGQPIVTFFAAGGTSPQNNVFKVTFQGTPITVEFKDSAGVTIPSAGSADVPLGPAGTSNTIINQIAAAMATAGFGASASAVLAAGLIRQEGAGIRFRGSSVEVSASIVIGNGPANSVLGFSEGGTAFRTLLDARVLASGLMSEGTFSADALAKTVDDAAGASYLYIQSLGNAGAGSLSSLAFEDAASDSALLPGGGLGVQEGEGAVGEDAIEGFYVTSSDPVNGSGTANTSVLNAAVGQDGNVGQTYRDSVTGLTFTVLPRTGGASYPTGQYFTLRVRKNAVTNANIPTNTLPGVQLLVSNTLGISPGDTAIVSTYAPSGAEPSVGDLYYVSYDYRKQDFSPALYTKMSTISAVYGANSPENPVTLASYLSIINGAVLVAIKQVPKDTDVNGDGVDDQASVPAYEAAIDDVEGPLPGGAYPDYIIPLRGDSLPLFQYLSKHCDIQSSIRYRAERTAIFGLSAGTEPREAGNQAQAIGRARMRMVYPDICSLSLTDAVGQTETYLVDGTYLAAAVAGTRAAPSVDVATPWTNSRIFGFDEIARVLDPVEQNQVAARGVTVLYQQQNLIKIRQGLTTDMTNILTKLPTVTQIADEVQKQARNALDKYIGTKFLPGVTGQIEGTLSSVLQKLQAAQIIAGFTGVSAKVSDDDPTVAEIEAYYQPVFPLLYIIVTFNVRSSL
jgi:hypothetical protein